MNFSLNNLLFKDRFDIHYKDELTIKSNKAYSLAKDSIYLEDINNTQEAINISMLKYYYYLIMDETHIKDSFDNLEMIRMILQSKKIKEILDKANIVNIDLINMYDLNISNRDLAIFLTKSFNYLNSNKEYVYLTKNNELVLLLILVLYLAYSYRKKILYSKEKTKLDIDPYSPFFQFLLGYNCSIFNYNIRKIEDRLNKQYSNVILEQYWNQIITVMNRLVKLKQLNSNHLPSFIHKTNFILEKINFLSKEISYDDIIILYSSIFVSLITYIFCLEKTDSFCIDLLK